jgi:hypothetical protein
VRLKPLIHLSGNFDRLFSQPKKVRENTREAHPQQVVYQASLFQSGKNGIISD